MAEAPTDLIVQFALGNRSSVADRLDQRHCPLYSLYDLDQTHLGTS